jgi:hypothetical protein
MISLKNILKEVEVAPGHENDRDMVVGVAEILRMVDDMNNRKEYIFNLFGEAIP